ncbi:MAG: monofunctional biosynthetic peptidoglycan transglycosylase [Parvularculaceae bacterium]
MARSKKKARKRRGKKKRAGPFRRIALAARVIGWVAVLLFFGSLIWAAALRFTPPGGTLLMVERSWQGQSVRREWAPLEDISPHLVRAVIAAEDTRFCRHYGVDLEAIDEALEESKNGKRLRGASTISQQTAKNVFLWNGRSWLRKGGEAWFTLLIETFWPKRRIMEVYLNVAEWGDGLFGAEAAAKERFGVSAKNLTPYQAALLAAVLPNPKKWRVDPPGPYVRSRARTLRARMGQVRRMGLDQCVL